MHRCYVPDAFGDEVVLPPDEAHHLARVLRLGIDSPVVVFDGRGGEWLARIASVARAAVTVRLIEPRVPLPEPAVAVTLAVGLLKGDQMNGVVRDATALGVAAILPFVSEHVDVPERAWRAKSTDRWARVAVASARQCGRSVVPAVHDIARYPALLNDVPHECLVCCVEPARASAADPAATARPAQALVCVGPEGGWSADELAVARRAGARLLTLGPRTLRAEIAPTVALSVLWTEWGWG